MTRYPRPKILTPGCPDLLNVSNIDNGVIPFTRACQNNGMVLNREHLWELSGYLDKEIERLGGEITEHIPQTMLDEFTQASLAIDDFNIDSPDQIATLLFRHLRVGQGVELEMTPTGDRISTGKKQLERIKKDHPIIPLILQRREYTKLQNTYCDTLPNEAIYVPSIDRWKFYYNIGLTFTSTGRMTVSRVHQIPIRTELGRKIRQAFEPEPGMVFISADYCLDPKVKVLKSDLSWVPIAELRKGDELIGFDEEAPPGKGNFRRRMRRTKVERIARKVLPRIKITTTEGEIICSTEHRWLACKRYPSKKQGRQSSKMRWVEARNLEPGMAIAYFGKPWNYDASREAGYLAGILDGEGWVHDSDVGVSQKAGPLHDHIVSEMKKKGYHVDKGHPSSSGCFSHRVNGGRYDGMRVVGELRPRRILANSPKLWEGKTVCGRYTVAREILKVERIADGPVIAMRTGTGTFIADGYLSHNSGLELRILTHCAEERRMIEVFSNPNGDIHQNTVDGLNMPPSMDSTQQRLAAKRVNFGIVYGTTDLGLWLTLQSDGVTCTREQCAGFQLGFFATYPDVAPYITKMHYRARRYGFSYNIFGRVSPAPEFRSVHKRIVREGERRIQNYVIQSTATDVFKIGAAEVYDFCLEVQSGLFGKPKRCEPLLPFHDQILLQCDKDIAVECAEAVGQIMGGCVKLRIPLKVDNPIQEGHWKK